MAGALHLRANLSVLHKRPITLTRNTPRCGWCCCAYLGDRWRIPDRPELLLYSLPNSASGTEPKQNWGSGCAKA